MSDRFFSPTADLLAGGLSSAGNADPSGPITIAGNDGMEPFVERLCARFKRDHPDVEFHLAMLGSSTAFPALASDACVIAPMSRAPWAADRAAFKSAKGHAASVIHIGYTGHGPRPGAKTPPSLYVHASNPLAGLPMADVARVFSSGSAEGDINFWHQLGLGGDWAERRIHLYGLRDDGKYASGFRDAHLAGRAYAIHYETLPDRASILKAVSQDPFGIGSVGWFNAQKFAGDVRVLALSRQRGGRLCTPVLNDVAAGDYPLSAFVSLYFDRSPNAPFQPWLKDYLALALSDEGQAILSEFTWSSEGYVPLSAFDLQAQRRALADL